MPVAELTDDEVFGAPKELSDAEVFGHELSDEDVGLATPGPIKRFFTGPGDMEGAGLQSPAGAPPLAPPPNVPEPGAETIGPDTRSDWQRFRESGIGHKLFGSTDIERENRPEPEVGLSDILLSPAGMPFGPGPETLAGKAVMGLFTADFARRLPDQYRAAKAAYERGDWQTLRNIAVEAGFGGAMTGIGLAHMGGTPEIAPGSAEPPEGGQMTTEPPPTPPSPQSATPQPPVAPPVEVTPQTLDEVLDALARNQIVPTPREQVSAPAKTSGNEAETTVTEPNKTQPEVVPTPETKAEPTPLTPDEEAEMQRALLESQGEGEPERVVAAAIRQPNGDIRTGRLHPLIEGFTEAKPEDMGFVTNTGRFISREEANRIAGPEIVKGKEFQEGLGRFVYPEEQGKVAGTHAGDYPFSRESAAGPESPEGVSPTVAPAEPAAPLVKKPVDWDRVYRLEIDDMMDARRRMDEARRYQDRDAERAARQDLSDSIMRLEQFDKLSGRDVSASGDPAAIALRNNERLTAAEAEEEGRRIEVQAVANAAYDDALDAGLSHKEARAASDRAEREFVAQRDRQAETPVAKPTETGQIPPDEAQTKAQAPTEVPDRTGERTGSAGQPGDTLPASGRGTAEPSPTAEPEPVPTAERPAGAPEVLARQVAKVDQEFQSKLGYGQLNAWFDEVVSDTLDSSAELRAEVDKYFESHPPQPGWNVSPEALVRNSAELFREGASASRAELELWTPASRAELEIGELALRTNPELKEIADLWHTPREDRPAMFAQSKLREIGIDPPQRLLTDPQEWSDLRHQVYERDPGLARWIENKVFAGQFKALRQRRPTASELGVPGIKPKIGGQEAGFTSLHEALRPVAEFGRDLYNKVKDFGQWSAAMVKRFGESVRDHLQTVYDFVKSGFEEAARDRSAEQFRDQRGDVLTGWKFPKKPKTPPPELANLDAMTDWLRKNDIDSPSKTLRERLALGRRWEQLKGAPRDALDAARSRIAAAWNAGVSEMREPTANDFMGVMKDWHFWDTQSAHSTHEFQREISRKIPNANRRAGIIAWIQAGGDQARLEHQAEAVPERYKAPFEAATKLTEDEKTVARQISADWADKLKKGQNLGVIKDGHANYAPGMWSSLPVMEDGRQMDMNNVGNFGAKLDTRAPFMAFHKSAPTYFDGIMAGGVPRTMDAADLVGVYNQAFNKTLSSRAMVLGLREATAKDGKPVVMLSGRGEAVPAEDSNKNVYLVNPHSTGTAVAADGRPYRVIDHPALRDWNYLASTPEGEPIIMRSDFLVHPDHYQFLKNVLGESALRRNPVTGSLLKLNQFLKASKLTLGTFHLATEAEHAIFHGTAPWLTEADRINLKDPRQGNLVRNGLDLGMHDSAQLFSEGLASNSGLFNRIPGIGKLSRGFSDWLFKDYIPTIKMKMALHALDRNTARYVDKLTPEQIYDLTARQANAAFGGLNYRLMGRSPFLMDSMRLMGLAPDFLEARGRFVAQAFKPYGGEQRRALLLMAATTYIGARVMNSLLDDHHDPHWGVADAFSVYHGGRKYTLRTVLADAWHMFSDPRSFWYNRVSPILRTGVELATGRDWRGIKRSSLEQLADFARWALPAGSEGLVNRVTEKLGLPSDQPETTMGSAALGSIGLPSKKATAEPQTYDLARKFNRSADAKGREYQKAADAEARLPSPYRLLDNALDQGRRDQALKEYDRLVKAGHTPEAISARFEHMATHPYTGDPKREAAFKASLSVAQLRAYNDADKARYRRAALLGDILTRRNYRQ